VKDVIIMAGRSIYPTDIERAAGRVEGVRRGCAVAVRLDAGRSRECFAVAVESNSFEDPAEVRRIERQVAREVVAEVKVRPRYVVVLGPGVIPKTPSGKLRRANALALLQLTVDLSVAVTAVQQQACEVAETAAVGPTSRQPDRR
jgi:fatty-acyl-CoA synthase